MNPRDYRTWTSFADHPVYSEQRNKIEEWSSDPSAYDLSEYFPREFDPNWYLHQAPNLPSDIQAAHAARDILNLCKFCAAFEYRFGAFEHELFILDDCTVYVRITHPTFRLELMPHDFGDRDEILTLYVESPFDDELMVKSVDHAIDELSSRSNNA